jgi:hypothetical protein
VEVAATAAVWVAAECAAAAVLGAAECAAVLAAAGSAVAALEDLEEVDSGEMLSAVYL